MDNDSLRLSTIGEYSSVPPIWTCVPEPNFQISEQILMEALGQRNCRKYR